MAWGPDRARKGLRFGQRRSSGRLQRVAERPGRGNVARRPRADHLGFGGRPRRRRHRAPGGLLLLSSLFKLPFELGHLLARRFGRLPFTRFFRTLRLRVTRQGLEPPLQLFQAGLDFLEFLRAPAGRGFLGALASARDGRLVGRCLCARDECTSVGLPGDAGLPVVGLPSGAVSAELALPAGPGLRAGCALRPRGGGAAAAAAASAPSPSSPLDCRSRKSRPGVASPVAPDANASTVPEMRYCMSGATVFGSPRAARAASTTARTAWRRSSAAARRPSVRRSTRRDARP